MSDPWGPDSPWKSSVAFYNYLRGCLRSAWSRNPCKHNLIKKKRYQIPNPNKNGKKPTVWGAKCSMCEGEFPLSQIQVDHINPAGSLQKKEDIQGFVERLLFVSEDDLRLVCKECNSCLAYADKHNISFEQASREKKAIALQKSKEDFQFIEEYGRIPAKSKEKRRKQIIEILEEIGNE